MNTSIQCHWFFVGKTKYVDFVRNFGNDMESEGEVYWTDKGNLANHPRIEIHLISSFILFTRFYTFQVVQDFLHQQCVYDCVCDISCFLFSELANKRTYLKRTSTDNQWHRETWVSKHGFQPNIPHPNILFMEEIWVISWEGWKTSLIHFNSGIVLPVATTG